MGLQRVHAVPARGGGSDATVVVAGGEDGSNDARDAVTCGGEHREAAMARWWHRGAYLGGGGS